VATRSIASATGFAKRKHLPKRKVPRFRVAIPGVSGSPNVKQLKGLAPITPTQPEEMPQANSTDQQTSIGDLPRSATIASPLIEQPAKLHTNTVQSGAALDTIRIEVPKNTSPDKIRIHFHAGNGVLQVRKLGSKGNMQTYLLRYASEATAREVIAKLSGPAIPSERYTFTLQAWG
jgi:hypothetical protein